MVVRKKRICAEDYNNSELEELWSYAIPMGCKTEIEFTMFLKARESIFSW